MGLNQSSKLVMRVRFPSPAPVARSPTRRPLTRRVARSEYGSNEGLVRAVDGIDLDYVG
jgi:hypothetical protein